MDQIRMKLFESASIVRNAHRIYTGVCIDPCSALGIYAWQNVIFNRIDSTGRTVVLGEITPEWRIR